MSIDGIIDEIITERQSQDKKWGVQHHHLAYWFTILGEEIGELAQEILELDLTDEESRTRLRSEAIQSAAVIVAMLEDFESVHEPEV